MNSIELPATIRFWPCCQAVETVLILHCILHCSVSAMNYPTLEQITYQFQWGSEQASLWEDQSFHCIRVSSISNEGVRMCVTHITHTTRGLENEKVSSSLYAIAFWEKKIYYTFIFRQRNFINIFMG